MKIKLDTDIQKCSECPFYRETSDGGYKIYYCKILGVFKGNIPNPYDDRISKECPFNNEREV